MRNLKLLFDAFEAVPIADFYAACIVVLAAIVLLDVRARRTPGPASTSTTRPRYGSSSTANRFRSPT